MSGSQHGKTTISRPAHPASAPEGFACWEQKEIGRGFLGKKRDKKGRRDREKKSTARSATLCAHASHRRAARGSSISTREGGIGRTRRSCALHGVQLALCLPVCLFSPSSCPLSSLEGRILPALFSAPLFSTLLAAALFLPLLLWSIDAEWSGLLIPFHVLFFISSLILVFTVDSTMASSDPGWKYAYWPNLCNRDVVTCTLCGHSFYGGIKRLKQHLAGGFGDTKKCTMTTTAIRKETRDDLETRRRRPQHP